MEHHTESTKNRTSKIFTIEHSEKNKTKSYERGCKETYCSFNRAAGTSERYKLLSACDNNLFYSSHVWTMKKGGYTEEKH